MSSSMSRSAAGLSGGGLLSLEKPAGCLSRPMYGDRNAAWIVVFSPHTGDATRFSPFVMPGPTQSAFRSSAAAYFAMAIQKFGSTSRYTTAAPQLAAFDTAVFASESL